MAAYPILHYSPLCKSPIHKPPFPSCKILVPCATGNLEPAMVNETKIPRYKWVKTDFTQEQAEAISQLPFKMTNRCKALMKQMICYSPENGSVSLMLEVWVKSTNPRRADWLAVLKELCSMNHPLYLEVAEYALTEESFEANVRDYTKIIHAYAKGNMIEEAEKTLTGMRSNGFVCDQVMLTALLHMYSKNGDFERAESLYAEMKLLGVPLDRRSYGAMIMAYVRAGRLSDAEELLREMGELEIYAGSEVYKALLRAYSRKGDSDGAQRVFDAIQIGGIIPDARICGHLMNAYVESGRSREACVVFENMRRAGVEPNDKCVALVLAAYEKGNKLKEALGLLVELEKDGFELGEEASSLLAKWFRKLGVVEEVELVLRDLGL